MTQKFVKDSVRIAIGPVLVPESDTISRKVSCERLEPDIGLCITRHTNGGGYAITHTRSGCSLSPALHRKPHARKLLVALKGVADWTVSAQELLALRGKLSPIVAAKVAEAVDR